ncbi:MAG: DUF1800 family protein [Lentimonas sp.]
MPAWSYAIDGNENGLSDVWEQLFNASTLDLDADEDGDSFTNLEECITGTDPYDGADHPTIKPLIQESNPDTILLSFDTVQGKHYKLFRSEDLDTFMPISDGWIGSGGEQELAIQTNGIAQMRSPVTIQFWSEVDGEGTDVLTSDLQQLSSSDGTLHHDRIEAPIFLATGYGAKINCRITTQKTGDYTFFLSSGGPAELYIDGQENGFEKIAEVLSKQSGIQPLEWGKFSTQRSLPIELIAGERYALEILYLATKPNQHVQVGWMEPGTNQIKALNTEALAPVYSFDRSALDVTLFEHDYDSTEQTGTLWPANTTIVSNTSGMIGNAEFVQGDAGDSTAERIHFELGSKDHLYGTWLFQMKPGVHAARLFWINRSDPISQEGPRIDFNSLPLPNSGIHPGPAITAGGAAGNEARIDIEYDTTYRIEKVTTLSSQGYEYETPLGSRTVEKDHFDIYVSDLAGNLVGSARGLTFRDGENTVEEINSLSLAYPIRPQTIFDNWKFTTGQITGDGYLIPNTREDETNQTQRFFKLNIQEIDQDNDSIPDWEELALAEHHELLFFDAETIKGVPDSTRLQTLLDGSQGIPEFMLYGSDICAIENNYPNAIPDNGEITITRDGALTPVGLKLEIIPLENTGETNTICDGTCCILVGTAGDEAAETEDYQLIDEDGNVVNDTVYFDFGESQKVLKVIAVRDTLNEYPETLNIRIADSADGSYTASRLMNGASIQLFDLPDSPDNETIFTGSFSKDGRAAGFVNGTGSVTATINGPRTEIRFWNQFSNLTSAQQDAHVHKSSASNGPGDIVYAITNTPGGESGPAPGSDPFNGQLEYYPIQVLAGDPIPVGVNTGDGYPWDLTESAGVVPTGGAIPTKQAIIDSLFGQNGESPLYLNIHTIANPAGEIWAFLRLSEGSIDEPSAPEAAATPGSAEYPQLEGALLEAEVRRFLNQATFGATDLAVEGLLTKISFERIRNPDYHRHEAFAAWIDRQMNPTQTSQTYLLDYFTASYMQYLQISGVFDPTKNPTDGITATPSAPTTWPSINRDDTNSELWYLNQAFPLDYSEYDLATSVNRTIRNGEQALNRATFNQVMINAKDQLRQKMGFALQQIVVVSKALNTVRTQPFANLNYQDQLNANAFGYYRDILGYVNWSPLMGAWLSSLKNQKAIDFDGDGLFDSYPDENLARENMQLFSIGLFNMWPDGTLRLTPNGLPEPSYTNADIQEFAKILTGQSFSLKRDYRSDYTWGGVPYSADNENFNENFIAGPMGRQFLYPMKMFGDYHSLGAKTFAGTTIDNSALPDFTAQGIADIEDAIDWLAGVPGDGLPDYDMVNSHVSTPAFISRRLIQRFTTSNPSTDYLHRVATIFKDSEGDLGQTLKAILLDPEARKIDLSDTQFGLKKSPLEAYFQLLRAFDAFTYIPLKNPKGQAPFDEAPGSFSDPDLYISNFGYPQHQLDNFERNVRIMFNSFYTGGTEGLQMNPFEQETVFNYYLPDFSPGGTLSDTGMVAPELQLANEPDIIRNINYFEQITRSPNGQSGGIKLGSSNDLHNALFNSTGASKNSDTRLPLQKMADSFYPVTAPNNSADIHGRTSESIADEALLDALDLRLTNGLFKMRYPYDPTDDDDPHSPGIDDLLKNPRELIIDSVHGTYGNPFDGIRDAQTRRNKLQDLLFLLSVSPEYQVKK